MTVARERPRIVLGSRPNPLGITGLQMIEVEERGKTSYEFLPTTPYNKDETSPLYKYLG